MKFVVIAHIAKAYPKYATVRHEYSDYTAAYTEFGELSRSLAKLQAAGNIQTFDLEIIKIAE